MQNIKIEKGICRICGCTAINPCWNPKAGYCYLIDESETLCSHCVGILKNDKATVHKVNDIPGWKPDGEKTEKNKRIWHYIADDDYPQNGQCVETVNTFNQVQTAEYNNYFGFSKTGSDVKLGGIWAWRENPEPPEKPEKCKCDLMDIKGYCNSCWVRSGRKTHE